ncbi:MAG: hypothetical protein RMK84_17710 [Oscillochloridaceae bacterium]|nr:hypothetical protein [Chloroflexaceae bacterium]MDW8391961.1 hypothetical protein [Oscillochloridaceae bacterium]
MLSERPRGPGFSIAAYDRDLVETIIRDWSAQQLAQELRAGRFGKRLNPRQTAELEELLTAWKQRALGPMPLRDALLVDEARGRRVFALICAALTVQRAGVPPELHAALPAGSVDLEGLPEPLAEDPALSALAEAAARSGLRLAVQQAPDEFPYPDNLEALTPPPPRPARAMDEFEQPTGWRRNVAILLAASGVALLLLPLLGGQIPERPAGLPLALITLALLVGIRAGWAGYAGSLCIWLVANLPGFHHGTALHALWPALPLLAAGLVLLSADRRVRAMWRWIRRRLPWQRPDAGR